MLLHSRVSGEQKNISSLHATHTCEERFQKRQEKSIDCLGSFPLFEGKTPFSSLHSLTSSHNTSRMTGRAVSKSPAPTGGRRSSRHSTPTRITSPGPTTRSTRSSGAHLLEPTAGTPSLAPLVPSATSTASSSTGLSVPKSPSMRALSPRASARSQRPALPLKHINRQMNPVAEAGPTSTSLKEKKTYRVKTQILDLGEGNGHIGIARVKVPVPKGVPG